MVRYSCRAPNANYLGFPATPEGMVATAERAEALGYDALMLNDHILVDSSPRAAPWVNTYDPLLTAAHLAAKTSRIRLGTSVLIMPYRNPMATAKMFATLDQLSGGRAIAGVGVGWSETEFAALGVPYRERGARTDEYLAIWQACWGPDPVSFTGKYFAFERMHISPKPVQRPHPPVWVGGSSDAALARAARFAQVWQPMQMLPAELGARKSHLASLCAPLKREPPETRMSVRVAFTDGGKAASGDRSLGQGTVEQVAADLHAYRQAAGVDAFQINFMGCRDLAQLLEWMGRFMAEVKPRVEG